MYYNGSPYLHTYRPKRRTYCRKVRAYQIVSNWKSKLNFFKKNGTGYQAMQLNTCLFNSTAVFILSWCRAFKTSFNYSKSRRPVKIILHAYGPK